MLSFFKKKKMPERGLNEIKQICNILFIDDLKFDVVEIVKKNGWNNTTWVKDIDNLDHPNVNDAHIIFLDIQGVGKQLKFKNEGRGLLEVLKRKYPEKKVVAYSAESRGTINFADKSIIKADKVLRKNTDPYEFVHTLEFLAKECLAYENVIQRLKGIILKETGKELSNKKIEQILLKIYSKNDFSDSFISKIFNIEKVASILTIIKILFSKPI